MSPNDSLPGNENTWRYVSLITLTLQNAILGLSMRYARTRPGDLFLSSTGNSQLLIIPHLQCPLFSPAVLMAECVKLATCLVLVFLEEGKNVLRWKSVLHSTIVKQPMDTLKVCVPSLVYIVQNNLLYVSASHLDAATYQVSDSSRRKLLSNNRRTESSTPTR